MERVDEFIDRVRATAVSRGELIDVIFRPRAQLDSDCETAPHPAGPGFQIRCASELTGRDRQEALAHEYAHIQVEYDGLISVGDAFPNMNPYIIGCIGNALSHRSVVAMLQSQAGISSQLHEASCAAAIEAIRARAKDTTVEPLIRVGDGVGLWDISRTVPHLHVRACEAAALEEITQRAFNHAGEHLSQVTTDTASIRQIGIVREFLDSMNEHTPPGSASASS